MADMKNALVTGANSGIGKEIVRGLVQNGFHVSMLCRNPAKAKAARDEILAELPSASIGIYLADFASLKEVDEVANQINTDFDGLDLLVNNAGLYSHARQTSADGYEMTFAVNHLAAFALTERMLPLLKGRASQKGEARVVTVASRAHYYGRIDLNDLNATKKYNGMTVYGRSKMANILHTRHLATRLVGSGVTANCLHPGVIATNFASGQGGLTGWWFKLFGWSMLSPSEGADTALYLALSPEVKGKTGGYYYRRRLGRLSRYAADSSLDAPFYRRSLEMIAQALQH